MKSLPTITTVETRPTFSSDSIRIDGLTPTPRQRSRVLSVIDRLRTLARSTVRLRIESRNPNVQGKGLGFSASGFAALGLAASRALGLNLDRRELSKVVRLGAGSAGRSVVGGFSIWYANRDGQSYAEQLAPARAIRLKTIIVPIPSSVKTDLAHADAVTSPFYPSRLTYVKPVLSKMRRAIKRANVDEICQLAELDTLNLHAVTMTGREEMILFSSLSIMIMSEVRRLREEDKLHVWYSLDTGPSVFVNTTSKDASRVHRRIQRLANETIASDPGGPAETVNNHLF